ncbi:MAG: hypothetical protein H7067_04195 [Burkholderiales bacterium]|nr:hypothetical protein [Opitutaceae bacterium]
MNSILPPLRRAAVLTKLRLLPIAALLGLFSVSLVHARENKVELPLILNAERAELRAKRLGGPLLSESIYYQDVVIYGRLEFPEPPGDYEPVGLHIDPTRSIRPEEPKRREVDSGRAKSTSTRDQVPMHWMAQNLATFANAYVLISARVEKRRVPEYRVRGSAFENTAEFEELLTEKGIEPRLVAHDFYVLLEAPGKEQPFPYASRPRATQYEIEREAWLVKNSNYVAQGLIYQPTKSTPDAYPERDVRVRHAAAALAKLTGKEVFVQPRVEKLTFRAPRKAGALETPELELEALTQQLETADVGILELNPRSIALVAD